MFPAECVSLCDTTVRITHRSLRFGRMVRETLQTIFGSCSTYCHLALTFILLQGILETIWENWYFNYMQCLCRCCNKVKALQCKATQIARPIQDFVLHPRMSSHSCQGIPSPSPSPFSFPCRYSRLLILSAFLNMCFMEH